MQFRWQNVLDDISRMCRWSFQCWFDVNRPNAQKRFLADRTNGRAYAIVLRCRRRRLW